jgi:hypothetical protein
VWRRYGGDRAVSGDFENAETWRHKVDAALADLLEEFPCDTICEGGD